MIKHISRPISWLLSILLLAALALVPAPVSVSAATDPVDIQDGVTLHCWNWSYQSIEENMAKIAALGYTAIQTSPIQQAKQATAEFPSNDWWAFYQPMGFHIDDSGSSALGTKAEFVSMCETAHEYGIKVIVDIVANHMGNTDSGSGISASVIPELKNDMSCWHDLNKNTTNYSDRYDVTQHCMDGLPDLNTASDKVQNYVLELLKECIDAGADGFRFDAVKHIETPDDGSFASDFWPTVIDGAKDYAQSSRGIKLYCYGELLDSPGGSLSVSSYTKYMSITDNVWGNSVRSSVIGGKNAGAFSAGYKKNTDASQLVIWAESHDTFAGNESSGISDGDINKTWALVAARADAMALYLARPANMSQYLGTASDTGWAYPEVAAVNQFHNYFIGQGEYIANESGIAYVERGTTGVVLVNCKGGSADVSVTAHTMADGTYTDQISGNTFTVSGGKITGTIGSSTGIAVVYPVAACVHTAHDADGFCTVCSALVGHSYDESGICACGDVEIGTRVIYFVNSANWKTVKFYSWYTPTDIISEAWPGTDMTLVEGNIYSCTVPVDAPNIIFNNTSTQTDDLVMPGLDKNMYDYSTGLWSWYGEEEPPVPSEPETPETVPSEPETVPSEPESDPSEPETVPSEPETVPSTPEVTAPSAPTDNDCQDCEEDDGSALIWIIIGSAVVVIAAAAVIILLKKKRS